MAGSGLGFKDDTHEVGEYFGEVTAPWYAGEVGPGTKSVSCILKIA
jgi:hypothetical protein